jgi:AcrR family transcriptional regulator
MQSATTNNHGVELLEKNRPQQQRAIRTYEAILSATGELLQEVGLERISTNTIAERAGVTVPALYRYFPNKYAVLNALGARLMDAQNEAFEHWHRRYVLRNPAQAMLDSLYYLLRAIYDVTYEFPGGLEIMHGMQAMAPLQAVRLDSQWSVAETFARLWSQKFQIPLSPDVLRQARMGVALEFLMVQIALEDDRLDPDVALRDGADALAAYLKVAAEQHRPESNQD